MGKVFLFAHIIGFKYVPRNMVWGATFYIGSWTPKYFNLKLFDNIGKAMENKHTCALTTKNINLIQKTSNFN